MSAAERAYADTLRKQGELLEASNAQLHHDLAELRAAEVDLRRENAALRANRAELRKAADRCLRFDRDARAPSGGMQTGDTLIVGAGDWFRLVRLVKFVARGKAGE